MTNEWQKTYNEEDNSELRRLQLAELDIFKFFIRICEKYQLRYYMIGGTMLGAIRHQGFIPWDDDTDVGMPRPDYEQFIKIIRSELPLGYDFYNYKVQEEYKRYFSRIVNKKIKVHNNSNSRELIEDAWLDIFPYDGMPNNRIHRELHYWRLVFLRFLYHSSCFEEMVNLNRPDRAWYLKIAIKFLTITHFGSKMDTKKILKRVEKSLVKYDFDKCDYIANFFGAKIHEELIPKAWLGEKEMYQFESIRACGPVDYNEFLSHFYGDYMTPPSGDHKDKHNITQIEYLD